MSKLYLWSLAGLLAIAPLYGCGSECANGTVDEEDTCVVAAGGCAAGTKLVDGECRLDNSGCGPKTVLVGNECVPAPEICDDDTTFDQKQRTCVVDTDIICGDGTQVGQEGTCVPGDQACDGTTLYRDGHCVVQPASCGAGTQLDSTTNECVLAESGCAQGLAFEADSGGCVATDEVCETGTKFDPDSGLCLPDSCDVGNVLSEGVCVSPAEKLAGQPNAISETENNDPALGGAADELTLNEADGAPVVFTGAIDKPADLDGNGTVDQDVDVFEFEAAAGQWLDISVLPNGLQAPAFIVDGPDGFVRYSPMGRAGDAERTVVTAKEGVYTLTVLPSLVAQARMAPDGNVESGAIGSAQANYAGTLEVVSDPARTPVDMTSGQAQLTGSYPDLADNYFELTNLDPTALVRFKPTDAGADVYGVLRAQGTPSTDSSTHQLITGEPVEVAAGGASVIPVLFDWISLDGLAAKFDVAADVVGAQESFTMTPGQTKSYVVSADAYELVIGEVASQFGATVDVTIADLVGNTFEAATLTADDKLRYVTTAGGDYRVTFTNAPSDNASVTLTAKSKPMPTVGALGVGDFGKYTGQRKLLEDETRLHKLTIQETGTLYATATTTPRSKTTKLTLRDSNKNPMFSHNDFLAVESVAPGTYFLEVKSTVRDIDYQVLAGMPEYPNHPNTKIPDGDASGITESLSVSGCPTVSSVDVFVNIEHVAPGNLIITLTSPGGASVILEDHTSNRKDDIHGSYPESLPSLEDLSAFDGASGNGAWELHVVDDKFFLFKFPGKLHHWGLDLNCQ